MQNCSATTEFVWPIATVERSPYTDGSMQVDIKLEKRTWSEELIVRHWRLICASVSASLSRCSRLQAFVASTFCRSDVSDCLIH